MSLYVIPATRRHTRLLSPYVREVDRKEIAAWGMTPRGGLEFSLWGSKEAYTVMKGRVPVGMFGVTGNGYIWLLGSELLTSNYQEFARASLEFVDRLTRPFEMVQNAVSVDNAVHIRWLSWLGAVWGPEFDTRSGVRFRRFYLVCSSSDRNDRPYGRVRIRSQAAG